VALALYLDDCAYSRSLKTLLESAGHSVTIPADAGLAGADDEEHFRFAIGHNLVTLTFNAHDFLVLHHRYATHPGVLAVYQDNDVNKDMSDAAIVQAIANLERIAGMGGDPIPNYFHCLNSYR
jgi:predicted nuclease of predicted toxin-antitoxin system